MVRLRAEGRTTVHKARGISPGTDQQERRLLTAWPSHPRKVVATPREEPHAAGAGSVQRNRPFEEQLAGLHREHSELHHALFEAAQAQRKLCAPRELHRGQFEIASEIFPVREISGDFYDVLDLGVATGLAVGDIAGKGLVAGLWFTHLIGLIRIHAGSRSDPAAAVTAINHDLCQVQPEPPTVTLFLGRLDPRRDKLVYCNAGHPPAFLLRRDGTVESLREGGPLLGALPHAFFGSGRVVMEPGDTLVGYSDGIVECRNSRDEEFGAERLLAAARNASGSSASTMLFSILGAVQDFAGSRPRDDDFTLIVVRRAVMLDRPEKQSRTRRDTTKRASR